MRERERERGQAICINQRMDMNVPFLCTSLPSPLSCLTRRPNVNDPKEADILKLLFHISNSSFEK